MKKLKNICRSHAVEIAAGLSSIALGVMYILGYRKGDQDASAAWTRTLNHLCLTGDSWEKTIDSGEVKLTLFGTAERISKD